MNYSIARDRMPDKCANENISEYECDSSLPHNMSWIYHDLIESSETNNPSPELNNIMQIAVGIG